MNAAARGLGEVDSTRPLSRAERRAAAAKVKGSANTDTELDAAAAPDGTHQDTAPAAPVHAGPSVSIPLRRKADKRPFSTQLRGETVTRLAWLVEQGGVLTETVDAAITAYLDAAGVPRPGPDGTMPKDSA